MTKFEQLVKCIYGSHVYIQTHNFPDPDAIASAYGLMKLLEKVNIASSIIYKGKIERYNTNGFINKLGIEMTNLHDISFNIEDEIILVDSQKGNSNIIDTPGEEIICIDHHPTFVTDSIQYRFKDIRPEIGSCSTIIAEYYFDNDIDIDEKVATALLYGIKTDTMGLSRGVTQADVDAFQKLFRLCDGAILQSLEHCSIMYNDLKAYAEAMNSIKIYGSIGFANTGRDCPEALIATISDFMLDLVEINFCVVYSIKKDGIKLSVRSKGKVDAGVITNGALSGIGTGGGHFEMAGGFVPFSVQVSSHKLALLINTIEERFINMYKSFMEREDYYGK